MARLNAPRTAGNSPRSNPSDSPQQDKPRQADNKGWPFAQGSQNNLDETSAPWPRPSSRSASKPSPNTPPNGLKPK